MFTLHLTLTNNQVSVRANGKESHQFSLLDLSQSEQEWKDFYKNPRTYGEKLFNALFRDAARAEFETLSKQAERTIVLVLESSELDGVAWEYAYNKAKEEYVVEDCAFVRALPEKERPEKRALNEVDRVPLLFIPANPLVDLSGEPMRALDVDGEWREMKRHIEKSNAPFDMVELRPATPEALQSVMARFQNGMIAHFSGHGAATKDGAILLFERENGASNPLEAREFVREIKDKAWIGFLSACQSAVPERTEFSNLARELAKAGVPFALGMQFNLPDPFAPNISGQFYNYLAHGHAVPEAARQARRAVKRENEFFVGMIALYAAHPDEVGKLVWRGAGAQTMNLFRPADVSDLPSPASGLIGRQRELMRIGTRLLDDKKPLTVTLHGAGGIGKTALLWQALLRFAPSFELTLAIGLDPLPSLESVLGRIERFLLVPSPCSNDTQEREALVRNALTSKRTLLGLDNFETLNHAVQSLESQSLETLESKATAKSLYAFFKSLPAEGVTLCVTSREKTNLPGEHIEEIYGLEDAMGGALFYENVSTRKDALNEAGLEKLSAAIGGHPLALRLLAPIFEEQAGLSLTEFIDKVQTFLPKASDQWTEQQRHESLGACFAFSMDNLPKTEEGKNLQIAISRLSVFIAFFVDFTAMPVLENHFSDKLEELVEMLPKASSTLHALWERGLLERITIPLEEENHYLYRLHPTLYQFAARRLAFEDLSALQEIHWRTMCKLAGFSYPATEGGGIYSSSLLSIVARVAIPDMLKATKLKRDRETSILVFYIGFLRNHFGDLDGAMELYQQSREISEGLGELQIQSLALHGIAAIYITRGNLDGAMMVFEQLLGNFEKLGELQDKGAILNNIAQVYVIRGDLDGAMKLYQQSLEISENLGYLKGKSATIRAMAGIYNTRGDLDGAMKLYQQSLEISENLGDLNGKSDTLHNMANIYVTRGDLDGAMNLYQQALKISENLGDLKGKAVTIGEMAKIFVIRGNLDKGLDFQKEKLDIAKEIGDKHEESVALQEIANIYVVRGDFDEAMQLCQQALKISEDLGNPQNKSNILRSIAVISITRGNLDGAMSLCQQALEIDENLGDLNGKSATLNNIALIYATTGDLDRAMQVYQQSLEIKEGLGNLKGKSTTLHNMAQICTTRGDLDEAMKLYRQALEIADGLGDLKSKALTLNNIGVVLFQSNHYEDALKPFLSALEIFIQLQARFDIENSVSLLNEFQQAIGNDAFRKLWQEATGNGQLPDWLAQQSEQQQGMTAEQFIAGAIQSAREKRPEAEEYFKSAQKMAADSSVPAEMRELGRVLQRIMIGDRNVDLSSLPREWAEAVKRELG